jgi:hypothetical protein
VGREHQESTLDTTSSQSAQVLLKLDVARASLRPADMTGRERRVESSRAEATSRGHCPSPDGFTYRFRLVYMDGASATRYWRVESTLEGWSSLQSFPAPTARALPQALRTSGEVRMYESWRKVESTLTTKPSLVIIRATL